MKQQSIKLLFAVFLFLLPLAGGAQTSWSHHASEPHTLEKHDIVKDYNYPVIISSSICHGGSNSHFVHTNLTFVERLILLQGYDVNDFVIDNDTVFFCGKDRYGNGAIGFFNIQDLFFNGGNIYVAASFPLDKGYHVAALNKLITYRDATGKRHIVCIGQATEDTRSLYPCIVDLYSEAGLGYIGYNAGRINDKNLSLSTMDIKRFCTKTYPVTDQAPRDYLPCDYLVVAGTDINRHLCLRFFDAQNPLSASGPQNLLYTFDGYPSAGHERFLDQLLIYPISDSSIAVASVLRHAVLPSLFRNQLNICEINIQPTLLGATNTMTRSVIINIAPCDTITHLNQFLYNSTTRRFAVLLNGIDASSGNPTSYFLEANRSLSNALNLLTGYDTNTTCGDKGFTGLDIINSTSQYLLYGHCRDYDWQYNISIESSGFASQCHPQTTAAFYQFVPPTAQNTESPVIIISGRNSLTTTTSATELRGISHDCP